MRRGVRAASVGLPTFRLQGPRRQRADELPAAGRLKPPRRKARQIVHDREPQRHKADEIGIDNAPRADGGDGVERRGHLRAVQRTRQTQYEPWVRKAPGAFLRCPVQRGQHRQRDRDQRRPQVRAHLRHPVIEGLQNRLDRRGPVADHPGAHRVAGRGHAVHRGHV